MNQDRMNYYDRAQLNRQRILDYLNAHPRQTTAQIAQACGLIHDYVSGCVIRMRDYGEIVAEGPKQKRIYTALATRTFAPERGRGRKPQDGTASPPWLTVHLADDEKNRYRHSHGGQGAIREPFGKSSMEYV